MADQKPCVRCDRPIDAYARSCVYCSWDQAAPRPAEEAPAMPVEHAYVPPPDNRARNKLIGAAAFVALVILAFSVGAFMNREHGEEPAPTQTAAPATSSAASTPRSTVTLVPVEGGVDSVQPDVPVTSAPAQPPSAGNVDVNGERADATALPSEAYSAAARRANAERAVRTNNGTIDPRTIVGGVEPRAPRTAPAERSRTIRVAAAPHTQPIPLYQPVPPMSVNRPTSARLFLTVGSDGRVHNIDVAQSIPGEMPRLIASVQNWRFRPATENGQPVTSTFSVDINVHPR